ncbi:hypothetical protein ACIPRL_07845 [Streptomyces sp. NPDC090085]|uniref:hypothetical protein n=1 Tax=Streptomyces sp. NPDC090085 TaxID=3365943 RepID=UPI0037FC6E67
MVVKRKSVPMGDAEVSAVERIADVESPERAALNRLAGGGIGAGASEAALMGSVFALGLAAVQAEADEAGYAALAAQADEEDAAYEAAVRGRGSRRRSSIEAGE